MPRLHYQPAGCLACPPPFIPGQIQSRNQSPAFSYHESMNAGGEHESSMNETPGDRP